MFCRIAITRIVTILICVEVSMCVYQEHYICHMDFTVKTLQEGVQNRGMFHWLGYVQYVHITTNLMHYNMAPRVVLIHKQFALGTANEMTNLPRNYKLGNVVFGDYERDEKECNLTPLQLSRGEVCPDAYLVIPQIGVTVHPEFSRFGISNSLALVKLLRPLKSVYMVAICLPTIAERRNLKRRLSVFLVDYLSNVPNDLDIERMALKKFPIYLHDKCVHDMSERVIEHVLSHVLCTPGCGVRLGSPIFSVSPSSGRFELIGLAIATGYCLNDTMRSTFTIQSPLYIDIYPYVSWITNIITAYELPNVYPKGFGSFDGYEKHYAVRRKGTETKKVKTFWIGHTYTVGDYCFEHPSKKSMAVFFYYETFRIRAPPKERLVMTLQVSAGIECIIACARLKMPVRANDIDIAGVGGFNITIKFGHKSRDLPRQLHFTLGLMGLNSTKAQLTKFKTMVHANYTQWW